MGIFSRRSSFDDFALKAEDLATCEGYVTADTLRKLEEAQGASRSGSPGIVFSLARLVASKLVGTVEPAVSRDPVARANAPLTTAPLAVAQPVAVPAAVSSPPSAGARSAPLVADDVRRDKAA